LTEQSTGISISHVIILVVGWIFLQVDEHEMQVLDVVS